DWSSDVYSSDLSIGRVPTEEEATPHAHRAAVDDEPRAVLTSYRRRLRTFDLPVSRLAWAGAMALFGLALVLRLWGLGSVGELIFDETYYVKDGYTLTQEGVEMSWPEEPDAAFDAGAVDSYEPEGSYVVHPPLGKWLIGGGMMVLGADIPWGWRISSAVLGSLAVLLLARIGRRLMGSTTAGLIAGLLLAVDGVHLVHSRTSLLDPFLMFFALAAFGALLIDRDRFRERLALASAQMHLSSQAPVPLGVRGGLRPWRLAAEIGRASCRGGVAMGRAGGLSQ